VTDPPLAASSPRRLLRPAIGILVAAIVVILATAVWPLQFRFAPSSPTPVGALPLAASGAAPATPLPTTGVFVEPGDSRAPVLDEIRAARRSLDLEIYLVSDEAILRALEEARGRGVDVRVILEQHPFGGEGGQPEIFARLQNAGIAVQWGNPLFHFTHLKRTGTQSRNS
jgi:cardiolipin synthase A/B